MTAKRQKYVERIKKQRERNQQKLARIYAHFVRRYHRFPTRKDLARLGYHRDVVRQYFANYHELNQAARRAFPECFTGIIDQSIFTPDTIDKMETRVKKYKRFVITTAVVGRLADTALLETMQNYCRLTDAALLILTTADPASAGEWVVDGAVGLDNIVISDLAIHSNVFLSAIKTSAKQIDPITGLDRIAQNISTLLYASPKQRLKFVPVSHNKPPRALMTTGAITRPNYRPDPDLPHAYMSERTAYIANHDHVMGGIVLEIEDENYFHFRQLQADAKGGFYDLGLYYRGDSVTAGRAEAFSLGDWHSGQTDPTARQAWKQVCELTRPKQLILHDVFDGLSINPHDRDQQILLAARAAKGLLSLEAEVRGLVADLDDMLTWPGVERLVVVWSNHDLFLERWLQDGEYTKDPYNYALGVELAHEMTKGRNPLQYAVEKFGLRHKDKVLWLGPDDDYKIAGIQYGVHGHKGANGSRNPSLAGIEKGYGASTTGHNHGGEILRRAWRNGTSCYLKQDYNRGGASSWTHSSTLQYDTGQRQLINSWGGHWSTTYGQRKKPKK